MATDATKPEPRLGQGESVDLEEDVDHPMTNLFPLVFAARLAKEGRDAKFVAAYLAYHWNTDIFGEQVE